MPRLTKILNITYLVVVLLFLSDVLTGFDIRNQVIKSFVYYGFMIGAPVVFVWNLVAIKEGKKRAMGLVFPIVTLGFTLFIGPVRILFDTEVWRTQTILYQNSHRNFNTVEFQMQDIGGLGYNKRTVEVYYVTPLFMIASEIPDDINKRIEWVKVDEGVNELGLKGP